MTNKTALKRLKLDPYFSKTIETNLNVWSHDVNSFEIKFEFYNHECDKPIDLTGADMRILLDHTDSQPKVYPLEIESKILGLAKFVMPKEIRGCEGKFTAHIYADYPNKTHDFGSFIFYTKLSRIDKGMGGCLDTVYVSEFEKALQDIKDKSNQFEGVEKDLNERIDVIEKDIASNEIVKKSEFDSLKSEYDNLEVGVANLIPVMTGKWTDGYYNENGVLSVNQEHSAYTEKISIYSDEYTIQIFDAEHLVIRPNLAIIVISYDKNGIFLQRDRIFLKKNNRNISVLKKPENAEHIKISIPIPLTELENIKIKLEQGNIATDFTTAEGDIVKKNDLTEIKKQIDELKKAITTLGGTL